MSMSESDWKILTDQIKAKMCTPFLGAAASIPYVDLGGKIAQKWATTSTYPWKNKDNLTHVATYLAMNIDGEQVSPDIPKRKMVNYIRKCQQNAKDDPNHLYHVLAALQLPVYITTNYDQFMAKALSARGVEVKSDYCPWNKWLQKRRSRALSQTAEKKTSLVFHLHGFEALPKSLVLTEDDYIDFMVNTAQDRELIPPIVQDAMTDNSLLFLGYSLADWNFRVLFRSLQNYMDISSQNGHYSVLIEPDADKVGMDEKELIKKFFKKYFSQQRIIIYWGSCSKFAKELRNHLDL
jgi:hypothetical protein